MKKIFCTCLAGLVCTNGLMADPLQIEMLPEGVKKRLKKIFKKK